LDNGTLLQIQPESLISVDGQNWIYVTRVADGISGWMHESVITVATPAPQW